jgi:hypothetical protein
MKKAVFVFLGMVFAVSVFAQNGGTLRGVIQELNGTVEVKQSAASPWTPAVAGMSLDKDASISTGIRSSALIKLGDSLVSVKPLSRIRLEDLAASRGTADVALFLQAGRVRAKVAPPAGGGKVNFQVRSPSVTASVRGTEFNMDPGNVQMISGSLSFAGADGVPVLVSAGQSASAGPGGTTASRNLSPALPVGARTSQRAAALSPEGKVTLREEWYGENAGPNDQ